MIESTNNSHIKNIIKLKKNGRERRKQKLYIAEGPKMVIEAARLGLAEKVFIADNVWRDINSEDADEPVCNNRYAGLNRREMAELLQQYSCETVTDKVFNEMSDTVSPQGILALVKIKDADISDVICSQYGIRHFCDDICCMPVCRLLILEDIQDPGNLGTIFRTAEACGFNGILMNKGTADVYNPKAVRSTMGAILRMPFAYSDDICDIISECKNNGVTVYGMHLMGNDIRNADYKPYSAFVIGNESKGMSERAIEACDEGLRIPMNPVSESLNASVAAGVIMYQSSLKFL